MSGPRVKVLKLVRDHMTWICSAYMPTGPSCQKGMGSSKTLAAAADAGRAHLAEHHTAQMPAVAHGDPEPAYGAHRCSGECPPSPSSQCATCRQFFTTGAWGGPPMTDEQKTRIGWTR